MKKLAVLIGALTSTYAHAAPASETSDVPMYQEQVLITPALQVEQTANVGASVIEQRTGEYRYCIVPKFSENPKDMLGVNRFIVKSGVPMCRTAVKEKKYTAEYQNFFNNVGQQYYNMLVNYKPQKDGSFKICAQSICTDERDASKIFAGPYFIDAYDSHHMNIFYSGRDGDIATFTFSEIVNSEGARELNRDIKVDLSKENKIEYRGAKIEIVTATNESVTYKILQSFAQ